MTVLALLAAALAVPAGSAQFMAPNQAVYEPSVVGGLASLNWAGYGLTMLPSYTSVQGSWNVPTANCASGQASESAAWVGLGGFGPHASGIEQIGTATNCDGKGQPSYFAWYEMFPAPAVMLGPVNAGDAINASVVANADGTYTLTINGHSVTATAPTGGDNSSAEWIAEAPATCNPGTCRVLPLTDFGSVTFSNMNASTFDGPMFKIIMITRSPVGPVGQPLPFMVKAVPTPFDPNSDSFTVFRLHK
jgi:hypothetical protein